MLGLGAGEMMVIAVVALLVIGPDRLPTVMRQLGRWYGQLRRTADELRRAFILEADRQDASERYKQLQERRKKAQEDARRRIEELKGSEAQPAAEGDAAPEPVAGEALAANDIDPHAPLMVERAHAAPPPAVEAPSDAPLASSGDR
jgi:sec-independent protein translocase protein TatB